MLGTLPPETKYEQWIYKRGDSRYRMEIELPQELSEAAKLDGASFWQELRHVTLPLLTPTTFFLLVIDVIASLQVFDLVFVMTRIDQTNQLPTVVYYIYEEGFRNFRMGYAITVAWVLLAIILVFTLLQFRLQRRWVHYA